MQGVEFVRGTNSTPCTQGHLPDVAAISAARPSEGAHRERALAAAEFGVRLRLHNYLDRSVLEVFANDDTCPASRIYPTRPDSLGLDLFSRGEPASLIALDIYSMASIWD